MQPHINTQSHVQQLVHKLQLLTPERIAEVEDFIDFLNQRDQTRQLTQVASATAEPSFNQVWDNAEDADYDNL